MLLAGLAAALWRVERRGPSDAGVAALAATPGARTVRR
jgi:hypothetical protein